MPDSKSAAGWRLHEVCTLTDRVGLLQPSGELVVELGEVDDPEAVHEEALRVRTRAEEPRVRHATLEIEEAAEGNLLRGEACESAPRPLQADRRLRDGIG